MNLIAVDIGNTNITIGLFLESREEFIKPIPGQSESQLTSCFKSAWDKIPIAKSSKEKKNRWCYRRQQRQPQTNKLHPAVNRKSSWRKNIAHW